MSRLSRAAELMAGGEKLGPSAVREVVDSATELESIVRALAAAPIDDGPDTWCRLCGHERGNHAPVCALGRAREWVERNGHE